MEGSEENKNSQQFKPKLFRSKAWSYFEQSARGESAKCKICEKVIRSKKGTSSGLLNHLKSNHKIEFAPNKKEKTTDKETVESNDENGQKKSIGQVIAELVACDGINFHQLARSKNIRSGLKKDGYELPHRQRFNHFEPNVVGLFS